MSPTIRNTNPYKPFTVRIETAADAGRYCLDAYNIVVHGHTYYWVRLYAARFKTGLKPGFSACLDGEPRVRISPGERVYISGLRVNDRRNGLWTVTSTDLGGGESELVGIVDDFFGQFKASLRVAFEHYDSPFRCNTCGRGVPDFLCNHGWLRHSYNWFLKDRRQADKRNPARYDEDSTDTDRRRKPD